MKLKIYAIRDQQVDAFSTPIFMVSTGHAIRGFSDQVNDKTENNMLNKHAEDFALYALGEFDTDTGEFKTERPAQIALAKELLIKN